MTSRSIETQSKKSLAWWLLRGAVALLTLSMILVAASMINQQIAVNADEQAYPPPGRVISVGDHSLHLYCQGEGGPTVIMDAGMGSWSIFWWKVQPEIAAHTRVCSYDRAGFGWSESGQSPRSPEVIAQELHDLLGQADERPPFILVGHSYGGYLTRVYAATYPEEVVGMVLVDSLHEDQKERLPVQYREAIPVLENQFRTYIAMADLGIMRMGKEYIPAADLQADLQGAYYAAMMRSEFYQTWLDEMAGFKNINPHLDRPGSLKDIPLIVLSAGLSFEAGMYPPGFPVEEAQTVWETMQAEMLSFSTRSEGRLVKDSGHYIQLDRPEVVIEAILDVLERVSQ